VQGWPIWFTTQSPGLDAVAQRILAALEPLRSEVEKGYECRVVSGSQAVVATDKGIEQGVVAVDGTIRVPQLPSDVSASEWRALIHSNAMPQTVLRSLTFSTTLALVRLIDGLEGGLHRGDVFVPMVCSRTIIEHCAHYRALIRNLNKISAATGFDAENRSLQQYREAILRAFYATRVDWHAVATDGLASLRKRSELQYKADERRINLEAESTMDAIDVLSKTVKRARLAYEVLCEFAHPNVGVMFAVTRTLQRTADSDGVFWIYRSLGDQSPQAFLEQMGELVLDIFETLADALACRRT
jgi:hypothetical protein